jgi:hypothetical protein
MNRFAARSELVCGSHHSSPHTGGIAGGWLARTN